MPQLVLASVDTEAPVGTNPTDNMIYGKLGNGEEYGIRYLMHMFEQQNIRALFFVDIPEMSDHMADQNRRYLWEYSYDEQYDIIARCTDFYDKVLHRAPLSFRAGRYGANNDTLDVLEKLGYKYDMSEFYASRYCKISPEVTWNRVVTCTDRMLKEVPVTTFRSLSLPFYSRNDQIDAGNMPSDFNET